MRKKDAKKYDAICDAAIDLINSIGFANTSISKIAKKAGISPATIYIYFENKDDLLNRLYIRVHETVSKKMTLESLENKSVEEAFRILWLNLYRVLIEDKRSFEFAEQFVNSPMINEICQEEAWGYFSIIDTILEEGIKRGELKNITDEILFSFTFGAIIDLVRKHHGGKFVLTDDEVNTVLDLSWEIISS